MKKPVLQGFFGFVIGVLASFLLLAYEPQLIGDVQQGLNDLHSGASNLSGNEVAIAVGRPFIDPAGSRPADYGSGSYGQAYGADFRSRSYGTDQYANGAATGEPYDSGLNRTCIGSIVLSNRSARRVEIRPQPSGIEMDDPAPIALDPGTSVERRVLASGDCDRLNQPGAVVMTAEVCPLDGRDSGCYPASLPVVAELSDRRAIAPFPGAALPRG